MNNLTKEKVDTYRKIIDGAPEGATHYDLNGIHYSPEDYEYDGIPPCSDISDLRTIIALWDENQAWKRNENKIKADAVREAARQCSPVMTGTPDDLTEGMNGYCEALYEICEYADKLERGDN